MFKVYILLLLCISCTGIVLAADESTTTGDISTATTDEAQTSTGTQTTFTTDSTVSTPITSEATSTVGTESTEQVGSTVQTDTTGSSESTTEAVSTVTTETTGSSESTTEVVTIVENESTTEAATTVNTETTTASSSSTTTEQEGGCLHQDELWASVDGTKFFFCLPETNMPLEQNCPRDTFFVKNSSVSGCLPLTEISENCSYHKAISDCDGINLYQPQTDLNPTAYYLCPSEGGNPIQLTCPSGTAFVHESGYLGCFPWEQWREIRGCPITL